MTGRGQEVEVVTRLSEGNTRTHLRLLYCLSIVSLLGNVLALYCVYQARPAAGDAAGGDEGYVHFEEPVAEALVMDEDRDKRETGTGKDSSVEFIHPKLKEDMNQQPEDPDNPWVWLTSYSRIPVGDLNNCRAFIFVTVMILPVCIFVVNFICRPEDARKTFSCVYYLLFYYKK